MSKEVVSAKITGSGGMALDVTNEDGTALTVYVSGDVLRTLVKDVLGAHIRQVGGFLRILMKGVT